MPPLDTAEILKDSFQVTFGVTNMQETMAGYEVNVSEHLR